MSDARDEILRRIRTALADQPPARPIPRDYRGAGEGAGDRNAGIVAARIVEPGIVQPGIVDRFAERAADYRATVLRCPDASTEAVAQALTDILTSRTITRIIAPHGFPADWLPAVEIVGEPADTPLLDEVGAVLTTCRVAVAETGTLVLDHGAGMGPRALTLVPDYHCVVVRADQIVPGVPDAVAALDPTRPLTWISGPSATSDIELNRVEGVHGPRTLDILILGDDTEHRLD